MANRSAWWVIGCCLLPALAGAQTADLATGKALYQALKYRKAVTVLTRALTEAGGDSAERADIYVYIGLCRFSLGDERGARQAFRDALVLHREARLPPLTSPKIGHVFQEESAAVWTQPPAAPIAATPAPPPAAVATPAPAPAPPPAAVTVAPAPAPAAATSGAVAPAPASPPLHWHPWGAVGAAAVAAGVVGTAIYFGTTARREAADSRSATFASDSAALGASAIGHSRASNVLYGIAGATLVLGVGASFAF